MTDCDANSSSCCLIGFCSCAVSSDAKSDTNSRLHKSSISSPSTGITRVTILKQQRQQPSTSLMINTHTHTMNCQSNGDCNQQQQETWTGTNKHLVCYQRAINYDHDHAAGDNGDDKETIMIMIAMMILRSTAKTATSIFLTQAAPTPSFRPTSGIWFTPLSAYACHPLSSCLNSSCMLWIFGTAECCGENSLGRILQIIYKSLDVVKTFGMDPPTTPWCRAGKHPIAPPRKSKSGSSPRRAVVAGRWLAHQHHPRYQWRVLAGQLGNTKL